MKLKGLGLWSLFVANCAYFIHPCTDDPDRAVGIGPATDTPGGIVGTIPRKGLRSELSLANAGIRTSPPELVVRKIKNHNFENLILRFLAAGEFSLLFLSYML